MNNDQIFDRLKEIVSKVTRVEKEKINLTSSMRNDLLMDSLQAVQIVALIEEEFEISIDEVEIFNVDIVSEVVDLIKEYKGVRN